MTGETQLKVVPQLSQFQYDTTISFSQKQVSLTCKTNGEESETSLKKAPRVLFWLKLKLLFLSVWTVFLKDK